MPLIQHFLDAAIMRQVFSALDDKGGLRQRAHLVFRDFQKLSPAEHKVLAKCADKLAHYFAEGRDPNKWRAYSAGAAAVANLRDNPPTRALIEVACIDGAYHSQDSYGDELKSPALKILAKPRLFNEDLMEECGEFIWWCQTLLENAAILSPAQQEQLLGKPVPADPVAALAFICKQIEVAKLPSSVEDTIKSAKTDEAKSLAAAAIDLYASGNSARKEIAVEIFKAVVRTVPGGLAAIQPGLARFPNLYREGYIFFDAPAPTAAKILEHTEDANGFLIALSWTRDPAVPRYFNKLRKSKTKFKGLHVEPYLYAQEGGWELTSKGTRRDLVYPQSFRLVPPKEAPKSPKNPVAVSIPLKIRCGHCQNPLSALLDIDLADKRLAFLNIKGKRLIVPTCGNCWQWTFSRCDNVGNIIWLPQSERFDGADDKFTPDPKNVLALGPAASTAVEAVSGWSSYLGGHPTWIDDAYFPPCPDCKEFMLLLAHISLDCLGGDGIVYAWVCPACRTTATNYRCT